MNLACFQVPCTGGGTTSVEGTTYAPNGTLPLPGVLVYVPNGTVSTTLPEGASCDACANLVTGQPLVQAVSDATGHFRIDDMPATSGIPLVIQAGKWRRIVSLASVPACVDTPLAADETRLPKSAAEGHIPRIALVTGGGDTMECLFGKLGIDSSAYGTAAQPSRIDFYVGLGGSSSFDAPGTPSFADATTLWSSTAALAAYDEVVLSCEGSQNTGAKPAPSLAAMKHYADVGGRVYASHFQNYWLEAGPAPWPGLLGFVAGVNDLGPITVQVDATNGPAGLGPWLVAAGASSSAGTFAFTDARRSVTGILDSANVSRWMWADLGGGTTTTQEASFTTPVEAAPAARCGRFVFSESHMNAGDTPGQPFPSGGCTSTLISPEEKLAAFSLFELGGCVPGAP